MHNVINIVLLVIGLNIVAQLALIRKDHEQVLSTDYIKFVVQSILISSCIGMSYIIIEFFKDIT